MPIPAPGNVDVASQTTLAAVKAKTDLIPATLQTIIGSVRLATVNGNYAAVPGNNDLTITPPAGETWLVHASLRYIGAGAVTQIVVQIYASSGAGITAEWLNSVQLRAGAEATLVVTNADPLVLRVSINQGTGTCYYQYTGVKI